LFAAVPSAFAQGRAQKVRIQLDWQRGSEHAYLYLGQAKGFFRAEGIDVEIVPGKGSTDSVNMVDAGQVEFALASGESALQGRAASPARAVKVLAVFFPTTPAAIFSLREKNITKPADLYGKKVGVIKGSSAYKQYTAFMRKEQLDPARITEVPTTGSVQELIAPNSDLDAMVQFSYQQPLQLRLVGHAVNEIAFRNYGVRAYGVGLITKESTVASRPDFVRKFVRAVVRSQKYTLAHREEAIRLFLRQFPEQEPRFSTAKFRWVCDFVQRGVPKGRPLGYSDNAGWNVTMRYLEESGLITRKTDVRTAYTNQFLP
jgi:NitT/TauT family transport system substrate-binding protein